MKKLVLFICLTLLSCALLFTACDGSSNSDTADEQKYQTACDLLKQNKIEEAYALFHELKHYEPAQDKLDNFFYAPKNVTKTWKYADDTEERTRSTTYVYNSMGNILETGDGNVYTYDAEGNVSSGRDLIYGTYQTYVYQNGRLHIFLSFPMQSFHL